MGKVRAAAKRPNFAAECVVEIIISGKATLAIPSPKLDTV
jgi:hypothetical protein